MLSSTNVAKFSADSIPNNSLSFCILHPGVITMIAATVILFCLVQSSFSSPMADGMNLNLEIEHTYVVGTIDCSPSTSDILVEVGLNLVFGLVTSCCT